jgi:diamine N-acetyltransferase
MSTEIRIARIDDAAMLAALARETFIDTYAAFNTPQDMNLHLERSYAPDIQRREIADVSMLTIVAAHPDGLVGFAQGHFSAAPPCLANLQPAPQRPWEILRFYVHRDAHGKGVAQRLMQQVLQQAGERAADSVWLSVWSRNPRAQAFYRKCGFTNVGDTTFTLGQDVQHDFVMHRPLATSATG